MWPELDEKDFMWPELDEKDLTSSIAGPIIPHGQYLLSLMSV